MKGYGNLDIWLLPFFLIGVGLCLWRIKSPPHRAVVLAALATPVGAALVDMSITASWRSPSPPAFLSPSAWTPSWSCSTVVFACPTD